VPFSSREPSELSQLLLCRDDITVIVEHVVGIIIIDQSVAATAVTIAGIAQNIWILDSFAET